MYSRTIPEFVWILVASLAAIKFTLRRRGKEVLLISEQNENIIRQVAE